MMKCVSANKRANITTQFSGNKKCFVLVKDHGRNNIFLFLFHSSPPSIASMTWMLWKSNKFCVICWWRITFLSGANMIVWGREWVSEWMKQTPEQRTWLSFLFKGWHWEMFRHTTKARQAKTEWMNEWTSEREKHGNEQWLQQNVKCCELRINQREPIQSRNAPLKQDDEHGTRLTSAQCQNNTLRPLFNPDQ